MKYVTACLQERQVCSVRMAINFAHDVFFNLKNHQRAKPTMIKQLFFVTGKDSPTNDDKRDRRRREVDRNFSR